MNLDVSMANTTPLSHTHIQELSELRSNLEHREEQLKDARKHLELSNKERLMQAQQLGELQSALSTCRQQISMAHAAVAAESDRRLMGSTKTEDQRWGTCILLSVVGNLVRGVFS